ncbi:MAG: hypothetical protein KY469_13795 [Actinobacteria bacterium]|nr:hypothetical protein [Actinomycetota bacterium]
MRRPILAALAALALAATGFTTAVSPTGQLGDGNITGVGTLGFDGAYANSPNVYYLGTLFTESPGVGGKYVEVEGQPRFYMTGVKGLSIYDVSVPTAPVLMGHLPLGHFQNEDVDVSADGSRAIISIDTVGVSPTGGRAGTLGGVYVIDIEEVVPGRVLRPQISAYIHERNHTSTCADDACEWIYGSSNDILHVEGKGPDDTTITRVGAGVTGGHAWNRDEAGIMISDSGTRFVVDPSDDPANPTVVTRGQPPANDRYQHNNVRPDALGFVPRAPREQWDEHPEDSYQEGSFEGTSALRAGELFIGNAETTVNPFCDNAGGLSTWDMRDWDKGREMALVEQLKPANGLLVTDGRPVVNAGLGCSGHWFTVQDDLIAASWYEHGTRFVQVDSSNGEMTEVGWFQPVVTEAGAAHFVGQVEVPGVGRTLDIVYNVDYARGIDIIAFDREGIPPTDEQLIGSWYQNLDRFQTGAFANTERYLCNLASTNGGAVPTGTTFADALVATAAE